MFKKIILSAVAIATLTTGAFANQLINQSIDSSQWNGIHFKSNTSAYAGGKGVYKGQWIVDKQRPDNGGDGTDMIQSFTVFDSNERDIGTLLLRPDSGKYIYVATDDGKNSFMVDIKYYSDSSHREVSSSISIFGGRFGGSNTSSGSYWSQFEPNQNARRSW